MAQSFDEAIKCAEAIIDAVGRDISLAIPVGIGKPNLLVNALYRLVEADRTLKLRIFTGLSLMRPSVGHELEKRFVEPLLERLFGSYPELAYAEALRAGNLPKNIEVQEFFLQAGAWLSSNLMQQGYVSLNYVHVARHLQRLGVNVLAQLVAPDPDGGRELVSLSSNTDVTLDMLGYVATRRRRHGTIVVAAELNSNLPFIGGQAAVRTAGFDFIFSPPQPHFDLFAPPKLPVSLSDYAKALRVAALIKDGGTLQIGIGAFGDALSHVLILRHTKNELFRELFENLGASADAGVELSPFRDGLYGCSEMLVDGFLALRDAGVLTRKVEAQADGGKPVVAHAAFFLGSRHFYQALRELPREARDEIAMTAVSFTNSLLGDEKRRRRQRRDARFVNTAMIATLMGAVASDQLHDGRVVSGIGGQNDFVSMAHDLADARSILVLDSTRRNAGKTTSNIVWRYAHTSIPRQLRDIVVTEYGVADLRGKSDRAVIVEMLKLANSDFQTGLQQAAIKAGKVEKSFVLDPKLRNNRPQKIELALGAARSAGILPRFPLGTEMTAVEQSLVGALDLLKSEGLTTTIRSILRGLHSAPSLSEIAALERMGLTEPRTISEWGLSQVLLGAIRA